MQESCCQRPGLDIALLKEWLQDFLYYYYYEFYQDSKDQKTYFLKIHAPWDVLATYADVLKIKVPFRESDIPHGREATLKWISHPFRLPNDIMRPQRDYFTYPFEKNKEDFFLISDKETFFPPSTRNRIVNMKDWLEKDCFCDFGCFFCCSKFKCESKIIKWFFFSCCEVFYILARCPYYKEGQKEREKTGIKRLLSNGTYTAAFPLHDVRHCWFETKHFFCYF